MKRAVQKAILHCVLLWPFVWLLWQGWLLADVQDHGLGINPIEYINRYSGDWAVRAVLLSLAITPLRAITGLNGLIKFRRMIGLYAFFYVALHLLSFVALDHFFNWAAILQEIIKRPAITFGMAGFTLLLPLALTSTKGWIRRLGKNWRKLHRLIYPIGIIAVTHNMMMVKADLFEPSIHAAILTLLLAYRLYSRFRRLRLASTPKAPRLKPSKARGAGSTTAVTAENT